MHYHGQPDATYCLSLPSKEILHVRPHSASMMQMFDSILACKESCVQQPGTNEFCYWAREFCYQLDQRASEFFSGIQITEEL